MYNVNVSNLDKIWLDLGNSFGVSGTVFIPLAYSTPNYAPANVQAWAGTDNNGYVQIITYENTFSNVYITVEYTKTTDTTNTPITKRIKKVTQTIPPALLDNYSTEEQVVGTWIDGKPLYRKVIIVTNQTGPTITIAHNISNIDKVVNLEGICYDNVTNDYRILSVVSASNVEYQVSMSMNTTNILINAPEYTQTGRFLYISTIIKYTKTTDI